MRFSRTCVAIQLSLALVIPLFAQQTAAPATPSSPQALTLLQQSLAALTGGQSITDVTLSGTARRIAGSDDETGTASFKALAGTGSRVDLTLSSGNRSEIRNISGPAPAGAWSGPDGVTHPISYHNLLTDIGLFPAFTLASFLNSPNAVVTNLGTETKDGVSVTHLSAYQQPANITGDTANLLQRLSQMDIFLDASTNLPAAFDFRTHADNNALLDIPSEIRFTDYRPINGAHVPFHIQKFLNN